MIQHTPGPWVADFSETADADCNFVLAAYEVDADDAGRTTSYSHSLLEGLLVLDEPTNAANARLIAAAPELLATCEHLLAELDAGRLALGPFHTAELRSVVLLATEGMEAVARRAMLELAREESEELEF